MLGIILDTYTIDQKTIALRPARHTEYSAIVTTLDAKYKVKQTPIEIIKKSCEAYWSYYESRRQATIIRTDYRRRVPILISTEKELITFPTHATTDFECAWLFSEHIARITACHKNKDKKTANIIFHNSLRIQIDKSASSINNQHKRTLNLLEIYQQEQTKREHPA